MLVKQYNVYKSGELIGVHTTAEIERLIGINSKSVSRYCNTRKAYQQIYTFEDAEPKEVFEAELKNAWNEVYECAKLISDGQAVIRQIGNKKFTCRRKRK